MAVSDGRRRLLLGGGTPSEPGSILGPAPSTGRRRLLAVDGGTYSTGVCVFSFASFVVEEAGLDVPTSSGRAANVNSEISI